LEQCACRAIAAAKDFIQFHPFCRPCHACTHTHLQPQTDMQMQEEEEGTGRTRHGQNGQSSKPYPSYTTDQRTTQLVNPMFFFPFVKNCHELRIP
jgi:hypothetical protein